MKPLTKFDDNYFLKYKEKPVNLYPYSSKQLRIARLYIKKIKRLLKRYDCEFHIRGSTYFKIMGKGEVEIGIYPKSDWNICIDILTQEFSAPENLEKNYARFNDKYENKEVEIIVLDSYEAEVDMKLHKYLKSSPKLLKEYIQIKKDYCFSKREYQRHKNIFLEKVIKQIPD